MRQVIMTINTSPKNMACLFMKTLKCSLLFFKRDKLSKAVKEKRLQRRKVILNKLKSGMAGKVVWSDEKIFYS